MIKRISLLAALIAVMAVSTSSAQTTVSRTQAEEWFSARSYLDGLKLVPGAATDKIEFFKQYTANKAVWDKVFAYLKATDLSKLAPGKYPVPGTDLFASVTEAPTKAYEQTAWESHRKFIDLQYVIEGAEKMGLAPVTKARVTEAYNPAKDVAHYEAEGEQLLAVPGTFMLFFPSDAHRPNIKAEGADRDKKIVVKINYVE